MKAVWGGRLKITSTLGNLIRKDKSSAWALWMDSVQFLQSRSQMAVSCAICSGDGVAVALSIAVSEIAQHG